MADVALQQAMISEIGTPEMGWAGPPIVLTRTQGSLQWDAAELAGYTFSFVYGGESSSVVTYGRKRREFHFTPGSFYALPKGQHWDSLRATGAVNSLTLSLDGLVREESRLERFATPWFQDRAVTQICLAILDAYRRGVRADPLDAESQCVALVSRLAQISHESSSKQKCCPSTAAGR